MEVWCLNLWTSKEAPRHTINGDFMHNEESLFSHARKALFQLFAERPGRERQGRGGMGQGRSRGKVELGRGAEEATGVTKKKNTQDVAMMAG